MPHDFPIPFNPMQRDPRGVENPWGNKDVEPTDLITLWPGETRPTLEAVLSALQTQCQGKIEIVAEPPVETCAHIAGEGHPIWAAILQLPEAEGDFPVPIIVWAEPMRNIGSDTIKHLKAETIKWSVGVETYLWPADPAGHFMKLLRLLGRAAPQSPGILDVNKEGWHLREELDGLFLPVENEITESILWFVHAVGPDSPPTEKCKVWIYTQGLDRCGLPELEMLEVPYPAVGSAIALVNSIGELIVENGAPNPGKPLQVGDDLAVTLHPWRDVAQHVDEKLPGHLSHRQDHSERELLGARAAVCAAEPAGAYCKIWTWPSEVVEQLAIRGPAALYKTRRAALRQQQLARASWEQLVRAHASLSPKARLEGDQRQAVFLVQATFQKPRSKAAKSSEDGDEGREHLWFEVKRFHSNAAPTRGTAAARAEGTLVNEPFDIPHLRQGDVVKIDPAVVTDWQVLTRRGHFNPTNVDGLLDTIQQINAAVS